MALIDGMLQELELETQTTRPWSGSPTISCRGAPTRKRGRLDSCGARRDGACRSCGARGLAIAGSGARFCGPSGSGNASELVPTLDQSIARVKKALGGMDDAALMATWRLMRGDRELLALPRVAFVRSVMLNHWYHHRGQLTVYLRELNVPLPSIDGPSADENPFA